MAGPRRRRWLHLLLAATVSGVAPTAAAAQQPMQTIAADSTALSDNPSARGAFLRSLVVPGWGQSYVGAHGRGLVYFALEVGTLWMDFRSRSQLANARDQQAWLRESGRIAPEAKSDLVRARESQAQDWLTLSIFILLFSGADAYVSAQLSDFSEHVGVQPGPNGAMQIQASVPFSPRR